MNVKSDRRQHGAESVCVWPEHFALRETFCNSIHEMAAAASLHHERPHMSWNTRRNRIGPEPNKTHTCMMPKHTSHMRASTHVVAVESDYYYTTQYRRVYPESANNDGHKRSRPRIYLCTDARRANAPRCVFTLNFLLHLCDLCAKCPLLKYPYTGGEYAA